MATQSVGSDGRSFEHLGWNGYQPRRFTCFFMGRTSHRLHSLIGFSVGLMLSVTALNLIPSALGQAQQNIPRWFSVFLAEVYTSHIHRMVFQNGVIDKGNEDGFDEHFCLLQ